MNRKRKQGTIKKIIIEAVKLSVVASIPFASIIFAEENIKLVRVEVFSERLSDTNPYRGYNFSGTSSSTKTDALLINVPQAITVIPQEVIKDQSVLSISDSIRYVPGVTSSQG